MKFKAGERWKEKNGAVFKVVAIEDGHAIAWYPKTKGVSCFACPIISGCTKTHEANGSPFMVEEPVTPGECRCKINWDAFGYDYGIYHVHNGAQVRSAVSGNARPDFIAWEYEDGYRSRVSPTMYRSDNGAYRTCLYDLGLPRENPKPVRAVAVILEGRT